MDSTKEQELIRLEAELKKYTDKFTQMQADWAETKPGSHYGNEYLEMQIKVYQEIIAGLKAQIVDLKK